MQTIDIEREIRSFLVDNFLFGRTEEWRDHVSLLGNVIDSTGAIELVACLQDVFPIPAEYNEAVTETFDTPDTVLANVGRELGIKPERVGWSWKSARYAVAGLGA